MTELLWQWKIIPAPEFGRLGAAAIICALVAAAVISWWTDRKIADRRRRWTVVSLRLCALAVLAFAALQPELRLQRVVRVRNALGVLVDVSKSMNVGAQGNGRSRLDEVKTFFESNAPLFDKLEEDFNVRYFAFDDTIKEIDREKVTSQLLADGDATAVVEAVRAVAKELDEEEVKGILLFSDGKDTTGVSSRNMGPLPDVPVNTFAVSGSGRFKDVAVVGIAHDKFAFVRSRWRATVTVKLTGYGDKKIPITLRQGSRVILSRMVRFEDGRTSRDVTLEFIPNRPGRFIYTVSVPVYADEEVRSNNSMNFQVRVVRDKIRVLQICGRPSWDERFLRTTLKSDPNIDLVSLFILRTARSIAFVPPNEMSLIPFPVNAFTSSELNTFDLLIFQDFNYLPYGVAPGLRAIAQFVREHNGAFVMIGGEQSFMQGNYFGTPVADILPVVIPASGEGLSAEPFRPQVTEAGLSHPVTALASDPERCRKVWDGMPELVGYNITAGPAPGAVVLLKHPSSGLPILAVRDVGTGRTLALTVDTSWRWNFLPVAEGGSNRNYLEFWHNAIRWLIRDPDLDRARMSVESDRIPVGGQAEVQLTVLDTAYAPLPGTNIDFTAVNVETGKIVAESSAVTGDAGLATARIAFKDPGLYEIKATARRSGEPMGGTASLVAVEEPDTEVRNPVIDKELLQELSKRTGGRAFELPAKDCASRLAVKEGRKVQLLERRSKPIWNNWAVLIVAVVLLGLEWHLRRSWGLA